MQKKNNGSRDIIIGIAVSIAIFLLIIVFVQVGSGIDQEYSTNQSSEYGNWDGHIDRERESMESGLFLFPEDISSAKDSDYLYYCAIDYHSISQYMHQILAMSMLCWMRKTIGLYMFICK